MGGVYNPEEAENVRMVAQLLHELNLVMEIQPSFSRGVRRETLYCYLKGVNF